MPIWIVLLLATAHAQAPKAWQVECADAADCSPSVGALFHASGTCTSFLIAEDIVATNAHCVPGSIKNDGDSCDGQVSFMYPASGEFKAETLACDHLLSVSLPVSKDWIKVPDFAFFKLKKPSARPFLKISRDGVADNQALTLRKINFHADQRRGEIVKVTCKGVQNSVYNPLFSTALSPVVALGSCPVIPGNSGSPMIDADGEVRAILSAMQVISRNRREGAKPEVRGFGSNLGCINLGFTGVGYGLSKDCINIRGAGDEDAALKELYKQANETAQAKLQGRLKALIATFSKRMIDSPFNWELAGLPPTTLGEFHHEFHPWCRRSSKPVAAQNLRALAGVVLYVSADDDGRLVSEIADETTDIKVTPIDGKRFTMEIARGGEVRESTLELGACK